MELEFYPLLFFALIIAAVSVGIFVLTSGSFNMPDILRYDSERFYFDPSTKPPSKNLFPSLRDEYSVSLSVIIPAYNEEYRLPVMLNECLYYLERRCKNDAGFSYEVIIVDDGSSDGTSKLALNYVKKYGIEKMRLLTLESNRGKGGAVRLGMLSARGKKLLFADADGATKFCDVEKLETELESSIKNNENCVVIGSRAHLEEEAISSRSFFRTTLMYGFHFLVWFFVVRAVRDTQCGFKLFSREAAQILFSVLHVQRWAFDVELLYIAEKKKMVIKEVAVNWTEIDGSKLVPFWSWLQMGSDLVLIWLKYQTGVWKIDDSKKMS